MVAVDLLMAVEVCSHSLMAEDCYLLELEGHRCGNLLGCAYTIVTVEDGHGMEAAQDSIEDRRYVQVDLVVCDMAVVVNCNKVPKTGSNDSGIDVHKHVDSEAEVVNRCLTWEGVGDQKRSGQHRVAVVDCTQARCSNKVMIVPRRVFVHHFAVGRANNDDHLVLTQRYWETTSSQDPYDYGTWERDEHMQDLAHSSVVVER